MRPGAEVLAECVPHLEAFVDPAYEKEFFAITQDRSVDNDLTAAHKRLTNLVTTWSENQRLGNPEANAAVLDDIIRVLAIDGMQLSEFVSYWSVIDVTFSQYRSLTHADRTEFLREVLGRFVDRRHGSYSSHGYSAAALQSKADTFAHKRQGAFGRAKMELQLEARDIRHGPLGGETYYLWPDAGDSTLFRSLLDEREITFTWSSQYKGKLPDLAIVAPGRRMVIVEHKHMKEGGGGQDNVVTQLAEFVAQHQDTEQVHYVGYMDGVYFNKLFDAAVTSPKVREQRRQIELSLDTIPTNYFVNTFGFELLLDDYLSGG